MRVSVPELNFETLSIKKNNLGFYNLYCLMWQKLLVDGVETKVLCSIKSDNLIWDMNTTYSQNYDYTKIYGGKGLLGSYLSSITRDMLYNFTFKNIHNTNDVLFEMMILNGKKDEFMNYNVYEGLDNYVVKINVAGVKKEDVKIILEDGIIRVKTNPKVQEVEDMEVVVENFKPVKSECEIYLPNVESVEATMNDGILVLTVPKISKGVKIEIK